VQAGCGWDPVCYFYTGIASAGVNDNPLGIVQSGAAAASPVVAAAGGTAAVAYAPEAWGYGSSAVSSAWNWVSSVGIPVAQNSAYYLLDHPELLAAAGECGGELFPGEGPPPMTPVALGCHGVRSGLGLLGINW
jgi:hypothetical protein